MGRTVTISANRSYSNGLRKPINLRKAEGKKGAPKGHTLPFCENPDDVVFHRLASCGVFQRLSSGTRPITIPTKTRSPGTFDLNHGASCGKEMLCGLRVEAGMTAFRLVKIKRSEICV